MGQCCQRIATVPMIQQGVLKIKNSSRHQQHHCNIDRDIRFNYGTTVSNEKMKPIGPRETAAQLGLLESIKFHFTECNMRILLKHKAASLPSLAFSRCKNVFSKFLNENLTVLRTFHLRAADSSMHMIQKAIAISGYNGINGYWANIYYLVPQSTLCIVSTNHFILHN